MNTLTKQEQEQHAFFLGLAALLGEGVYNLGELLAHPVLDSLKNTQNSWLVDLLQAFNAGDIAAFEKLKPHWGRIADLTAQENKLRLKISLLCLMEMTFKRQANNRYITNIILKLKKIFSKQIIWILMDKSNVLFLDN